MEPRIFDWELRVTLSDGTNHTRNCLGGPWACDTALGLFIEYLCQDNRQLHPVHVHASKLMPPEPTK